MHEMSLCEDVVRLIAEQAQQHGFEKVRTVRLEIGRLACVEPAAMQFSFEAVSQGTIAEGSRLEIIDVAGQAWCEHCRRSVPVEQRYDACPDCGHYPMRITAGEEMRIGELEVE